MKRVFAFFRSMTFGMILLLLIAVCSVAGSLIPQQREAMEYVSRYGSAAAEWIVRLGLDDVFSTPYFIALMAALCLNLALCSVIRVCRLRGAGGRLMDAAAAMPMQAACAAHITAVEGYLTRHGYQKRQREGVTLYSRHFAGFYGSFLTHLALIVLLAVGAATLYGAQVQDRTIMPGETLTLEDGMSITVLSFQIEDETGRLDYASRVEMTDAKGQKSPETVVRVNEPLRFGGYKVYQQTYGTAGAVAIHNAQNGGSDTVYLTEPVFLTLDGVRPIAAVLEGLIQIVQDDYWGTRSIIHMLMPGKTMGESFTTFPGYSLNQKAIAQTDCVLLAFSKDKLLGGNFPEQKQILENLLGIYSIHQRIFLQKFQLLSRRKTRDRLLAYFSMLALEKGSASFSVPFTRQQMADFLCVERSAMCAELSIIQKEGILRFKGKEFELIQTPAAENQG